MGQAALVSETDSAAIVKVNAFRKSYRKRVAVQSADLAVRRGEIYGLLGPDGAGKSSLMKAIAGVMTFDSGDVSVFDVRLDSEAAAERIKHRIGFMPQGLGLNLYPDLSVEENIDFFARLRLVPERGLSARKQQLLAMTRLEPFRNRSMKKLSGGMKQKLGLICTLIHEPELLILDEPTTGVDPVSRRDFWIILSKLVREREITALVTTAYMDEASRFHRIALMYDGRILADGEPDQVCKMAAGSVVMLESPEQARAIERLRRAFPQVQPEGKWIRLFVDGAQAQEALRRAQRAMDELPVDSIRADDTELEDAFTALLRHQGLTSLDDDSGPSGLEAAAKQTPSNGIGIEARELSKTFGDFTAVDRVSFKVREGEIFGLLGANGAGKTTVIKMLTGIMPSSAGGGSVAGADLSHLGRAIKQRIGYMSQQFSLYTDLTVVENILLYAGIYGLKPTEARARCEWICAMGGLHDNVDERTSSLPVGMRQRLALGCALVHRPRVLFLDEPTSGIDPIGRQRFWKILFQLSREEGVTVLVTTHYMSEAEHCDHLVLMHAGRLVADASPETLKQEVETDMGHILEIETPNANRAIERLAASGFRNPMMFGQHVHVWSKSTEPDMSRVSSLLDIDRAAIRVRDLSMDDVFVQRIRALEQPAVKAPSGDAIP
jgi:ABC-2 type transport system ATP-binding protein